MSKKMCKLYSLAEKETKAYTKYILPARYVCKKCGRVANSDDLLCRPKELELKKVKDQKDKEDKIKNEKKENRKKKDKKNCDKKHKKDKTAVDTKPLMPSPIQSPPEPIDVEVINKYIVKAASNEVSLEKKRVKVSKAQVLK